MKIERLSNSCSCHSNEEGKKKMLYSTYSVIGFSFDVSPAFCAPQQTLHLFSVLSQKFDKTCTGRGSKERERERERHQGKSDFHPSLLLTLLPAKLQHQAQRDIIFTSNNTVSLSLSLSLPVDVTVREARGVRGKLLLLMFEITTATSFASISHVLKPSAET